MLDLGLSLLAGEQKAVEVFSNTATALQETATELFMLITSSQPISPPGMSKTLMQDSP